MSVEVPLQGLRNVWPGLGDVASLARVVGGSPFADRSTTTGQILACLVGEKHSPPQNAAETADFRLRLRLVQT